MTDDELLQTYGVAPAPALQPGVVFAPPSPSGRGSDEDLLKMYMPAPIPVAAPAQPALPPNPSPTGFLSNKVGDDDTTSVTKNLATGAIKGVGDAAGFVGNTGNLADYLVARGDSAITGKPVEQNLKEIDAANHPQDGGWFHKAVMGIDPRNFLPSGPDVYNKIFGSTGQYVPTTEAGRVAQGAAEAVTGSFGPGIRGASTPTQAIAAQLLKGAPGAAAAGGIGTATTNYTGDPLIGMLMTAAPGATTKAMGAVGNRFVGAVDPSTASLAQLARDKFNIPVTAPQISSSPAMRFGASALDRLPWSGSGAHAGEQQAAFNRAVSNTFGEDSPLITPEVMQAAKTRLGGEFDRVAQNTTIRPDAQLGQDLSKVLGDAKMDLTAAEMKPLALQVQNVVDKIRDNGGVLPGSTYQSLTKTNSPLNNAMNNRNSNISVYAGRVKDALDDAMHRSASPEDAAALSQAKLQYKNMKTVQDLAEKSTTGNISPPLLMGAVRKSYDNMAYRGGADIGDLARIGQRFLKDPSSSGTSERQTMIDLLMKGGALTGGAMGANAAYQSSPGATVAALSSIPASLIAGRTIGAGLRSDALAERLIGNSLGTPRSPGVSDALIRQLMVPYVPQVGSIPAVAAR